MARTNMNAVRVRPEAPELLTLRVLRSQRLSPHFQRVSLGGGDIARFHPVGFDQWFRLFIPVAGDSLSRLPNRLNTVAYLKFLAIAKTSRPILRNYTVRAYRDDSTGGPQLDVDLVLHEPADGTGPESAGPAGRWARTCAPGDPVAILDEGIGFHPPTLTEAVRLVADESALPAVAGILASLPAHITGHAIVEVPSDEDRQPLPAPSGVHVIWLARNGRSGTPGVAALAAARGLPTPAEQCYGWVAGEQGLASGLRRHWIAAGMPKDHIMFCGYWRAAR